MKYQAGDLIALGDIVGVPLWDGEHIAKVIMIGETGEFCSLDPDTAKWAQESGHLKSTSIMVEFLNSNPFEHSDPNYAPVSNTLALSPSDVLLKRRA